MKVNITVDCTPEEARAFMGLPNVAPLQDAAMKQMQAQREATDDYIRSVSSGGAAAEIEKAKGLLDSGAITQAEFDAIKQKALAAS